jgi:NAD(P)-dependent dehydrogenase (short-subunit alcohol dehydrogenase family)
MAIAGMTRRLAARLAREKSAGTVTASNPVTVLTPTAAAPNSSSEEDVKDMTDAVKASFASFYPLLGEEVHIASGIAVTRALEALGL